METPKKVAIGIVAASVLGLGAWFAVRQMNKGVVAVQTAPAIRENLTSVVTASGEIEPLNYTNVMAEGFGKITEVAVREGEQVKRGDVLMRLENIQPAADVAAQRASLESAAAAVKSAEASTASAEADVALRKADLEKAQLDWTRGQQLYKAGLIPKQDYDARKAAYGAAVAALDASQASVQQARADLSRARFAIAQNQAMLRRASDILRKTTYRAPIRGTVTYIAVRMGENVVPGIQNAAGSYLMTISDMSVVTAEVMVDETDIIGVKNGQPAQVTIDAFPGKVFQGSVTEVGTQAVLRTSGLASTQTTSGIQEAKDFKVVVKLISPPEGLRPGLSATAKITTARKSNVIAIPIQALAIRTRRQLLAAQNEGRGEVTLAAGPPLAREELQGVFVVRGDQAAFVPVQTGIAGVDDIEITRGISPGDQIVVGSYQALRTLRPMARVRVDNSASPFTGTNTE
jgi:HlyD family secretion protein